MAYLYVGMRKCYTLFDPPPFNQKLCQVIDRQFDSVTLATVTGITKGQFNTIKYLNKGAAIAQSIRVRFPSCRPMFESQAHHLHFHQFIELCSVEKTKINKRGHDWPIKKYLNKIVTCQNGIR